MPTIDLEALFTYHKPSEAQVERMEIIRVAALKFAQTIIRNSEPSPSQSRAIRQISDITMTVNRAIILNGAV